MNCSLFFPMNNKLKSVELECFCIIFYLFIHSERDNIVSWLCNWLVVTRTAIFAIKGIAACIGAADSDRNIMDWLIFFHWCGAWQLCIRRAIKLYRTEKYYMHIVCAEFGRFHCCYCLWLVCFS